METGIVSWQRRTFEDKTVVKSFLRLNELSMKARSEDTTNGEGKRLMEKNPVDEEP